MFKGANVLPILLFVLCGYEVHSQRISVIRCQETYSNITTPPTSHISDPSNSFGFGKVSTAPGEFPYMAALGWKNEKGGYDFFCGGVLIAPEFILTAASCTKNAKGVPPQIVRIGGGSLTDGTVENIPITLIHPYQLFNSSKVYNDIAAVKMASPSSQPPVCLWQTPEISQSEVTAIGYGKTSLDGDASNDLLKVDLDIISSDDCRTHFKPTSRVEDGIIDSQLCIGDRNKVKGICQGDYGGPLIVKVKENDKEIPYVVGIMSFGGRCGTGSPFVSTRISSFLHWIEFS